MAHEISIREDGMAEFAFSGPRSAIWHGLGQSVSDADLADLDHWKRAAGLDWEVLRSPTTYSAFNQKTGQVENITVPNSNVLFRSDTMEHLGIVSEGFKIIQPAEVVDFFDSLLTHNGFKMSSAGALFGGRKFWALANTGMDADVSDGDRIDGNLLLITAVDGTMATTARFVTTRVVCNNTLQVAVRNKTDKPIVRVTHHRNFDPDAVKIDLGLMDKSWSEFMKNMKTLTKKKLSQGETRRIYENVLFDKNKSREDQGWGVNKEIDSLLDLAFNGSGSDMSKGTAFGALCGATEFYTHGTGRRDPSHQFWSGYMGEGEAKKQKILDALMAIA